MGMKKKTLKIGYAAAVLFALSFPFQMAWMRSQPLFNVGNLLFSTCSGLIAAITVFTFHKVMIYNTNKSAAQLKKQLIPSYFLFVFITAFSALALFSPTAYFIYRANGWDTTDFIKRLFQQELPGVTISILAGVFLSTIVFFFTVWQQAIEREQQSLEEALKYKYKNLKAQVNPHFLFNSLNTLSEIVYVDARKADHYIQKLAGIYRYILDNEETDLISLHEELRFINRYFELQKERDGEKIRLEIDFQHPERYKIIPISLQILIENALKHNSASEENPLYIRIQQHDGYVVVSNTIQKRSTLNASHGTGLANLKERLMLITGKEMTVEMKNNQFVVKLPIIKS